LNDDIEEPILSSSLEYANKIKPTG